MAEKKVLFVIWGLKPGGAERVFVNIVNNINSEIKPIVTVLGTKEGFAEQIKSNIKPYFLNKKSRWGTIRILIAFAAIIRKERPIAILSVGYFANQVTVLARYISGLKIPVVINEQVDITILLKKLHFQLIRRLLVRLTYRVADRVIAVSGGVKDGLIKFFCIPKDIVSVIYNRVDLENIRFLSTKTVNKPWFNGKSTLIIIAVGRLAEQKGFPFLIQAFSMVEKDIEQARLVIVGEGDERKNMEGLITKLGLKDKVALMGYQQNPYKFISKSDVFVLSSLYEGFPNVLMEAIACDVPVVATRCPSGPEEIIIDGVNGYLVPVGDVDALSDVISKLLKDASLRSRLATKGRELAEDYKMEKMVAEYEKVLDEVVCC